MPDDDIGKGRNLLNKALYCVKTSPPPAPGRRGRLGVVESGRYVDNIEFLGGFREW